MSSEIRSPTKLKVLQIIRGMGRITTYELARRMNIALPHASKLLRTYWIQGLLHRETTSMNQGGIRYYYMLSQSGEKRLNFFLKKIKK